MSTIDVDVYSPRNLGQVGIGDVLYSNVGMTTPLAGGSTWWGFINTDNASGNVRGYKIDGSGVVIDMTIAAGHFVAFAFLSTTLTSNCSNVNFTTAVFAADDDPDSYNNKKIFSSIGGQTQADGNYTASNLSGGIAVWTFSVTSSSSKMSSVACCVTTPIVSAGSDATYNLPSPVINLPGTATDCDGFISTYSWTQQSGPNSSTITSPTTAVTGITGVIAGTYVYRLTATDNSSNSAFDDITVTIYPAPLTLTPHKLRVIPEMVYGLEGEDNRGVRGTSYNYYDGDYDPLQNKKDFDSITAGWQIANTSGQIERLNHDWFRGGLGRQVLLEFDTVQYITRIDVYDTTQGAGATVKFFIGDKAKMRKARWQGEFGAILGQDYTYTTKASPSWTTLPLTGQDSGQYVMIELNNFAIDVKIVLYGDKSAFNTNDTSITRKRNLEVSTDTLLSAYQLHKINNDGALPLNNAHYPKDSLPYYSEMRFYNAPIKTGPTTIIGAADPDVVTFDAVTGSYTSTNRFDAGPFGAGVGPSNAYIIDSTVHRTDGIGILQNIRGTNGLYASQSGYQPEHKPKNEVTSNTRSRLGWSRYAYMLECMVAKFYQTTSPAHPTKYRYQNDRWPGQFGLNFFSPVIEVDNEKDEGFRSDSAYMTPEEQMFQQSICYDTLKALQPSLTVLTNAFVSGNVPAYRAMIKNAYLYYGNRRNILDGVSWHTTVSEKVYDHTPTSDDLVGQHGAWPGKRNERLTMASTMLDLDRELGRHVPWYLTEVSYTKDSAGPVIGSPTYSDAAYSLIGAPQVKSHTPEENHAILYANLMWDYFGIPGVKGVWWYTNKDATSEASPFRKNADASNGITQYIDNPRKLYPAYWYFSSWVKRFSNWRFKEQVVYDTMNYTVDKWVCITNPDSLMYIVRYQNRNDASATVNLSVGNASSVVKWQSSFTSFNMTSGSQAIASNTITVTGRPEGDSYVFYSTTPTSSNPTFILRKRIRYKRG